MHALLCLRLRHPQLALDLWDLQVNEPIPGVRHRDTRLTRGEPIRHVAGGKNIDMKDAFKKYWKNALLFLDKHALVVAAAAIYGYYLLTTIDLFQQDHREKKTLLSYVLQFDSLIFMWIIAAVTLQLQRYRKSRREEEERRRQVEVEYDRQRVHLSVLDEITQLLQDNVNNPLAIISVTTHNIRRRFEDDTEILAWLDRIDSSLQRVHTVINDLKAYQTHKIVFGENRPELSTSTEKKKDLPLPAAS